MQNSHILNDTTCLHKQNNNIVSLKHLVDIEENNNCKKQQLDNTINTINENIQLQQQIEQKCIISMSSIYPYG